MCFPSQGKRKVPSHNFHEDISKMVQCSIGIAHRPPSSRLTCGAHPLRCSGALSLCSPHRVKCIRQPLLASSSARCLASTSPLRSRQWELGWTSFEPLNTGTHGLQTLSKHQRFAQGESGPPGAFGPPRDCIEDAPEFRTLEHIRIGTVLAPKTRHSYISPSYCRLCVGCMSVEYGPPTVLCLPVSTPHVRRHMIACALISCLCFDRF